jgi:Flp pilus assembly protein TadG
MKLQKQNGVAAIEFAFVLPILLMLVFGIVEFGIILYDKAMITNASREAARAAIVYRNPGEELTCADIITIVNDYSNLYLLTFGSSSPVTNFDPIGCSPAAGNPLTVTVSYQYDFLILPDFLSSVLPDPMTLVGRTRMIKE